MELATRPPVDIAKLQHTTNSILSQSCAAIIGDEAKATHYAKLFDRSSEAGFYASAAGPRGEGETPTWSPNPAYMDSLEEMWTPVEALLSDHGLRLEKTLRELFFLSVEYKDRAADHRRVFHGQLVNADTGKPVTYFMLNIPHSHGGFKYLTPPRIQIAELL